MRRVFISFHQADADEVATLKNSLLPYFDEVRTLGASAFGATLDQRINSGEAEYVMRRIREEYISGTSCTIVAIGKCTWARRYVDWEIAATLRNNQLDSRGGLFAMQLASAAQYGYQKLPDRIRKNIVWDAAGRQSGYARFLTPRSADDVATLVEEAITRRSQVEPVTGSTSDLRVRSAACE